jgi:RHS repeat-associated protein
MFTFRKEQIAHLRKERLAPGLVRQLRNANMLAERDLETGDVLVTDALGRRSRYTFGKDGFIGSVTTPLGRRYTLNSRSDGNPTGVTNPAGHQLGFEYYDDGSLAGVFQDGQLLSRLHYSAERLFTEIGWYDGTSTRLGYSDTRKVTSITNRLGHSERYEYGPTALLTGILDGNSNRTTFHYAGLDRPSQTLFPDGSREYYNFNATGHVEDIRSGAQHVVQIAYDGSGRPVSFLYGDGRIRELAYDGDGRLTRAANQEAAVTFAYDDAGRVSVEDQGERLIRYEYDAIGNLVGMVYPGGDGVRFAYDADRRLSSVTDWNGQIHGFVYRPGDAGYIAQIPGNVSVNVTTSPSGLPTACFAMRPGQVGPVFSQEWRYDVENHLVEFVDREFGARAYRYDAEGQVIASTQLGPAPPESFSYDAAGNRVGCNGTTATFNVMNQLTAQGPLASQHDERGNMTRFPTLNGPWNLTYDLQNQLVAANGPRGERLAFAYDALNRRILKRVERPGAAVSETRYVWAGEQMVTSVEVSGGRARTQEFLYLPGSYTPLATRVDGVVYSYHCDPLGRPTRLTDNAGRVVWSAVYGAFGELYAEVAGVPNPIQAPGQYHDEETGLYFNRFRYYSPHLGRYLSRDPVGLLDGPNSYAYVGNNPVNRADPLGLWWKAAVSVAAGAVAAVGVAAFVLITAPISVPAIAIAAGAAAVGVGVGLGVNKSLNLKWFCIPCFLGASAQGFLMGAGITAMAIAAALTFPAWATAIAVTGAVVGIGLMLNEHFGLVNLGPLGGAKSFDQMTPEEQSRSLGGLIGGLIGSLFMGRAARAALDPVRNATAASRAEGEAARANGAKRGMAAGLDVNGQTFSGKSTGAGGGELHPDVQAAYDNVPPEQQSAYHGKCAEGRAISNALNAGVDPNGGTSVATRISNGASNGEVQPACSSCQHVMNQFGVTDGTK